MGCAEGAVVGFTLSTAVGFILGREVGALVGDKERL